MDLIIAPFRACMAMPLLAFVPAAVFIAAGLWRATRATRFVLWVGVAWLLYAVYESVLFSMAKSSGEPADIRVDLLLIAPLLEILTLVAIILWIRAGIMTSHSGG
ncbi:MAG: hypothetical protein U0575_09005 [Phycisphaerales bacterium]|jgi:hypothetical protein